MKPLKKYFLAHTKKIRKGSNGTYSLSIPKDFVESMGWEYGTEIEILMLNEYLILTKKKPIEPVE